jgi:preprotein translocase subunit SecD
MRRKILTPLLFVLVLAFGGLAAVVASGSSPELGLDLQGGVSVVLAPTTEAGDEQLDQAVDIIRTRVDALGVAEPDIARQGDDIIVQLPGVRNRDRALALVGQTAELRFRPVLAASEPSEGEDDTSDTTGTTGASDTTGTTGASDTTGTTGGDTTATTEGAAGVSGLPLGESAAGAGAAAVRQETTTTTAPPTTEAPPTTAPAGEPGEPAITPRDEDDADATVTLEGIDEGTIYQLGPSLATGRIVQTAEARLETGQWIVSLTMRSGENGIDKFNEIAGQCFNRDPTVCPSGRLAIVLDSVVQSAPNISEPTYTRDQIQISGSFDESSAKDLALVLRYGSLPVELERQTVQTVSASLGEDSLRAGIIAGIVGLALVCGYMVLYYRALGIVVILGLSVWGSLMYSTISWLGESRGLALTLAGVTGIIVSIGVTVDSYVVYFERLKDEVKAGRTLRSSTERAFSRAFRTILTADVSAFMGAAILWWLTVGSVRGFAFFLGLSTVLDVAVAWFFTRPMVIWLSRNRVFTEMPVLGVARGLEGRARADQPAVAAGAGR